jgi:hypothetical protein
VADKIQKDKAGKEICEGLREGGKCKVLFLVTEKSGRVKNQDIETIKKILVAAPEIGAKYGIIVNKVKMTMLEVLKSESNKQKLVDQILGGLPEGKKCSENNIIFFGEYDALKGKSGEFIPPETFQDLNNVTLNDFVKKVPVISIRRDEVDDIKSESREEVIKKLEKLKSKLEKVIGKKGFTPRKCSKKIIDRISEAIKGKIEKNMRFRLGNAIVKDKLEEAVNALYERDFQEKNPIFIPELFIPDTPFDYDNLCEQLNAREDDENFSEEDKKHWNSKKEKMKREATERNVYELLKNFFESHNDHEVLMLHGYELMDTEHDARKKEEPHKRKDFVILNKTYGHILNIAVDRNLNPESLERLIEDLEQSKDVLEKWYGANLDKDWKIISVIYCEKSVITDLLKQELGSLIMDYIFIGRDNFPMQLEKLYQDMDKIVYELRFDWLFHL